MVLMDTLHISWVPDLFKKVVSESEGSTANGLGHTLYLM